LPIALGAALAQSYPRLEVLVSDNASTDDTASFLQTFADPRLRYLRHSVNVGANENYNYCLSKARGDYFLLLHDDDVIDEDFAAVCMRAADYKIRAGIICTGVRIIDQRGATRRESGNASYGGSLAEFYQAWFTGRTCWYLANTLFHTEQLRAEGGFRSPYQLAEDGFAIARMARFHRIDIPDIKASFRVHEGERTMADPAAALLWAREYLALLDRMCELVGPEEADSVRALGRRFFAQLAYNRAALMQSRTQRVRAACEVLRLFEYRCWPVHRSKTVKLFRRAARYARRRSNKFFNRSLVPTGNPRARQDRVGS
jgi:glycosyltransferase involved in cell wall biosynthesis